MTYKELYNFMKNQNCENDEIKFQISNNCIFMQSRGVIKPTCFKSEDGSANSYITFYSTFPIKVD